VFQLEIAELNTICPMSQREIQQEVVLPNAAARVQRPRAFKRPFSLLFGVFLAILTNIVFWWGIVALGMMLIPPKNPDFGVQVVVAIVAYAILRAFRYFHGLSLSCPLCHGPMLHEKKCHKHKYASRYLLFSYRASLILDIVTKLHFNCMYCGTPFKLKK
jgi:hypothetical protein